MASSQWISSTPVLTLALLVPVVYLVVERIRTRPGPPSVTHWIPWVGSALSMGKDPDGFFARATEKYGPLFRVTTFGTKTYYATSPQLINEIYRDTQTFVFVPVRLEISDKVFGTPPKALAHTYMAGDYFDMHHRLLAPNALRGLIEAYTAQAHAELKSMMLDVPQRTGRIRLRNLLLPPAYVSASRALLGSRYDALACFGAFQDFDKLFPLMLVDAPAFLVRQARRGWEQVVHSVEKHIARPDALEDASALVKETLDGWRNLEFSDRDIATLLAADLWALNANAIWAAYWLVAIHLQDRPEGLSLLVAEIDASRKAYVAANPSSKPITEDPAALHSWLSTSAATMPLLASAIQETLRFCSSSASMRNITRDAVLGGHHVKQGERVICFSRAVHLDDDLHEDAARYEPARYVDAAKVRTKDGKRVANHSMPFGGGVSMCEGRHFAQAELRTFVALLLTLMELRLDNASHMRAEMDKTRIGLGIMQAKGDVDVFVSPRVL